MITRLFWKTGVAKFAAALGGLILVGGSGCSSVRLATEKRVVFTRTADPQAPGAKVPVNKPKHQPTAVEKLNPVFWFGNLDDPDPPDWYRRDDPARTGKWYCRNALHNFTFYVIGIADQEFTHTGRFPGELFAPHGGWNWTLCRYRWLRLPLLSYKSRRVLFYAGWRTRGNFGLKLNFLKPHAN